MANTYSQVYIQIIFAVQNRINIIPEECMEKLIRYINGIITQHGQKSIITNGVGDHFHSFIGLEPVMRISDIAREIKSNSSRLINENHWIGGHFSWQEGYGVFSYSHSQINDVYNYILNQKEHHRKKTFQEEYLEFLKKFNVAYDERYIFKPLE